MKKSDYEMLSNEELKIMLADQAAYSADEIECAKQILRERHNIGHAEDKETGVIHDKEIASISLKNESSEDLKDIRNSVRTIRNCAIFFTVIAVIGLIVALVCGINLISTFSELAKLAK